MATLFRSASKLAFGSSRTPTLPGFTSSLAFVFGSSRTPLPGFTNSSAFVVQPCVSFLVPNRSPAHYTDLFRKFNNIVGKGMLQNVLASSSKEDLKKLFEDGLSAELNLLKDGGTAKLSLLNSQLFEIWCKLYDKTYSSQKKLYRLTVFEDNLERLMDRYKRFNEQHYKGANTLIIYEANYKYLDLTHAETNKIYHLGPGISDEDIRKIRKKYGFGPLMTLTGGGYEV